MERYSSPAASTPVPSPSAARVSKASNLPRIFAESKMERYSRDVEVPAFTKAIEAHQRRITQTILDHTLKICSEKNVEVETKVVVGDPKEKICEVCGGGPCGMGRRRRPSEMCGEKEEEAAGERG